MLPSLNKVSVFKMISVLALILFLIGSFFTQQETYAAFAQINVEGKTIGDGVSLEEGLFADSNTVLSVIRIIAGFVIVACLIWIGVRFARSQPHLDYIDAIKTNFIQFLFIILGGFVVYKSLDMIATWIVGLS